MKQYSFELLNSVKIGNVCESIESLKIREIFMSLKKSTMKNECGDLVCTINYQKRSCEAVFSWTPEFCKNKKCLWTNQVFENPGNMHEFKKSTLKNEHGDLVCTINYHIVWCDNNNAKCLAAINLVIEWGKWQSRQEFFVIIVSSAIRICRAVVLKRHNFRCTVTSFTVSSVLMFLFLTAYSRIVVV